MATTHIAHDCIVGNNVIMANIATLGGHVEIGDWCNIGGGAMIHQFVKIGKQSLIGGGFSAKQDVPPFIIGAGTPLRFVGINKVGLERRGFSDEASSEKPLLSRPTLLIPTNLRGVPAPMMNGGTSCLAEKPPPISDCFPIFTN